MILRGILRSCLVRVLVKDSSSEKCVLRREGFIEGTYWVSPLDLPFERSACDFELFKSFF